ncbi:MAG: hypothetical protein ABL883_09350 [Terricaulis sp.]
MRNWLVVAVAVAALGACQGGTEGSSACVASASAEWSGLRVAAAAEGEDCASAHATLTIKDADGATLFSETHVSANVMSLAQANDAAAMQAALADWINSSNNTMATSGALPDWPASAEAPESGEFPFYPEEGLSRDRYLAIRAADAPLFCFVQGGESQACLALQNGVLTKVGVQLFPG